MNVMKMAQEIVTLLDKKENTPETIGDNKISASIWNQFVGGGTENMVVGNGEKSQIKQQIDFEQAVKSVASYIRNKGTDVIKASLNNLGIDWNPSESISSSANTDDNSKTSANLLEKIADIIKEKNKGNLFHSGRTPIAEVDITELGDVVYVTEEGYDIMDFKFQTEKVKKYNLTDDEKKAKEIATSVKASNGMTYKEAITVIANVMKYSWYMTREQVLEVLEDNKDPRAQEFKDALAAQKELKMQHDELINYNIVYKDQSNRYHIA